jgi:hypothetical protein
MIGKIAKLGRIDFIILNVVKETVCLFLVSSLKVGNS